MKGYGLNQQCNVIYKKFCKLKADEKKIQKLKKWAENNKIKFINWNEEQNEVKLEIQHF